MQKSTKTKVKVGIFGPLIISGAVFVYAQASFIHRYGAKNWREYYTACWNAGRQKCPSPDIKDYMH